MSEELDRSVTKLYEVAQKLGKGEFRMINYGWHITGSACTAAAAWRVGPHF